MRVLFRSLLLFSACTPPIACVPVAGAWTAKLPASAARTAIRTEPASLLQSGKALLFVVRQTSNCPLALRRPETLTSTVGAGVGGGGAAAVSSNGKSAKPDIGAARLVPKAAIETIITPVSRMMRLMKIGRAHVCTPVTNAHLVCRL